MSSVVVGWFVGSVFVSNGKRGKKTTRVRLLASACQPREPYATIYQDRCLHRHRHRHRRRACVPVLRCDHFGRRGATRHTRTAVNTISQPETKPLAFAIPMRIINLNKQNPFRGFAPQNWRIQPCTDGYTLLNPKHGIRIVSHPKVAAPLSTRQSRSPTNVNGAAQRVGAIAQCVGGVRAMRRPKM